MAITKIHPIKSTLKKAVDYIVDPAKTDDKLLVSSFGCAVETADLEFEKTRLLAMQKGNNLAHQLIQAFEPGEVSYAQAHEIGRQLADEILGGKYEYVIATHINKEHCHMHGSKGSVTKRLIWSWRMRARSTPCLNRHLPKHRNGSPAHWSSAMPCIRICWRI